MDANTSWFAWLAVGVVLGTVASFIPGAIGGLLLVLGIFGVPIYIIFFIDGGLLACFCFLIGAAVPIVIISRWRVRVEHEAYRKKIEEQTKRRGNFKPS